MAKPQDEFIPTRPSLLKRLKDFEDTASWQDFYDTYHRLIFSTAIKMGVHQPEAEDVVQEVVLTVARTMPEFRYDPEVCSFKTWLMRLARSRIVDHLRKRSTREPVRGIETDDGTGTSVMNLLPDPAGPALEAIWEEEWRSDVLEKATLRVKARVNAEQYQMFDFYVLRKVSVLKVAKDLGVNVGQIYLAKHRVTKLIKAEVKALEEELLQPRWPITRPR